MQRLLLSALTVMALIGFFAQEAACAPFLPDAAGRYPPSSPEMLREGGGLPATFVDYPQLPGWPRTMGVHPNYSPSEGPATVDMDGDGVMEVFAASTDQKLYGWNIDGADLPGFPKLLTGILQTSPAIGDVDGDGAPEVLVATRDGWAYAFHADGSTLPGWPMNTGGVVAGNSVVLYDFDSDGALEVVIASGNTLNIWRGDGSNYPGFPVGFLSQYGTCSAPAVGDIDGDGRAEIVVEGWEWLHVFHDDGTAADGWPFHLPLSYEGFSYSAPVLVDFDSDGRREIVAAYHESGGSYAGKVCIWRHDGTVVPGWPYVMSPVSSWCYSTAAVGDVDEDGQLEIAMTSSNGRLYLLNFDGTNAPHFPVNTGYISLEASCAIADVDDDAHLEICFGSNTSPGPYFGYERSGTAAPGFPLSMQGAMLPSGSCIMDADGNGSLNICAHDLGGRVYMWDLPYAYHDDRAPWNRPHHDDHHTGMYGGVNPAATPGEGAIVPGTAWDLRVWPNPSAGLPSVEVLASHGGPVAIAIFDPSGARAGTIYSGDLPPGIHRIGLDDVGFDAIRSARSKAAGTYFLRMSTPDGVFCRRIVYVR